MSPKTTTAFRLDDDILVAMHQVKDEHGVPLTTQMEMALRQWLKSKYGIVVEKKKSDRQRVAARARS